MTDDPWLQFMQSASAPQGHSLTDILQFDDQQLEDVHTFIQWLFPLPEPSEINPEAPILTMTHCEAVNVSAMLKRQIGINLDLMLAHWGIRRQAMVFTKAESFEIQSELWITKFDHNHLRITRVLSFLVLTGFAGVAQRLHDFMFARLQDALYNRIGAFKYWQEALNRQPLLP